MSELQNNEEQKTLNLPEVPVESINKTIPTPTPNLESNLNDLQSVSSKIDTPGNNVDLNSSDEVNLNGENTTSNKQQELSSNENDNELIPNDGIDLTKEKKIILPNENTEVPIKNTEVPNENTEVPNKSEGLTSVSNNNTTNNQSNDKEVLSNEKSNDISNEEVTSNGEINFKVDKSALTSLCQNLNSNLLVNIVAYIGVLTKLKDSESNTEKKKELENNITSLNQIQQLVSELMTTVQKNLDVPTAQTVNPEEVIKEASKSTTLADQLISAQVSTILASLAAAAILAGGKSNKKKNTKRKRNKRRKNTKKRH
jgi:hypothetical protein